MCKYLLTFFSTLSNLVIDLIYIHTFVVELAIDDNDKATNEECVSVFHSSIQ
jgi:hypothetical protein